VSLDGDRIVGVSANDVAGEVTELGDVVLMPGLIDAHCHLEWALMDGMLGPQAFARWLSKFLPIRDRMRPEDPLISARFAALTALRAGTTTLADSGPTGAGLAALIESGQRGVVHLEAFGNLSGPAAHDAAMQMAQRVGQLSEGATDRVTVGWSPHAPYSVNPGYWTALIAHADLSNRPVATHLAESAAELTAIARGRGPLEDLFRSYGWGTVGRWDGEGSVIARIAANGGLVAGIVAAHCVHVDAADAERMARAGVAVAHCPASNRHLHCGRAPVPTLRRAGVTVAFGTDSPASAGPYDLRAEARVARRVHASAGEPLSARTLVEMMTTAGATALGLDRQIGSLTPGKLADLIAIAPGPGGWTSTDPYERALQASALPRLVMVDGRVLLDETGPRLVPSERIETAARDAAAALC
jgi:cytosine/adenosine deaminase-related metal-dependent hydrolase